MVVKIVPNDKANPPGKLADAELHFNDGVLDGLKLIGFPNGVATPAISSASRPGRFWGLPYSTQELPWGSGRQGHVDLP